MDKLKPILAQKFWIFFGIVLILPMVGYFMTKGGVATEIETRTGKLKTTFDGIPAGNDAANQLWIDGGKAENERLELQNRAANKALWDVQFAKMRWPKDVAPIMAKAEYFKPVPPEQGGSKAADKYQDAYPDELRQLWEIVDPLDDGVNQRDSDKRRKMVFAMASLQQANYAKWVDLPPTFDEIWPCQEDIWLQTELLSAVARINANAQSITDAHIKHLGKITLFGGTTQKDPGAGGGGAGGMGGGASGSGGADAFGGMMGSPMMGGGMGAQAATKLTSDIALAEEFVAEIEASGGAQGATGMIGGFGGGGFPESSGSSGSAASIGGAGGGTPAAKSTVKRYLGDDEAQKFKRRGFYIKLVMDHRKVPEFLAELMNSPFPVEIVRVHQVWLTDSSAGAQAGANPMASFMPTAGSSSGPAASFGPSSGASSGAGRVETDDAPLAALAGSSGPMGTRPGTAAPAPSADPNLASVSILGIWTLYRPNMELPPSTAPGGAAAASADVAATPATTPATETAAAADAAATAESTTTEPASETAPAKSDDASESKEAPKSDKVEGEAKPTSEPTEKKTDAEKPAPESKTE